MKTPVIIALFVISCMCVFSCQKDIMPPATTTGAGTMGFRVDGVKWVANSDDFKLSKTGASYWSSSLLEIYGVNHPKSRLELSLTNPKTGEYQFTNSDNVRYILYDNSVTFYLDITDTANKLVITRSDRKVISGTFSFKLKSSTGEIVSITSGRFDISINT